MKAISAAVMDPFGIATGGMGAVCRVPQHTHWARCSSMRSTRTLAGT